MRQIWLNQYSLCNICNMMQYENPILSNLMHKLQTLQYCVTKIDTVDSAIYKLYITNNLVYYLFYIVYTLILLLAKQFCNICNMAFLSIIMHKILCTKLQTLQKAFEGLGD